MNAQTLDICPNSRTMFHHVFKWWEPTGKMICTGCGKIKNEYHELEDWEAKKQ